MNKLIKGSIAAAAGVALLLGGAGSFALWNSSATIVAGTVSSGTLALTNGAGPTWKNVSADSGTVGGVPISSISTYKIVPGDILELTQVLNVTATGDNLKATLSYDDATIAAIGTNGSALKAALTVALDATGGANVTRIFASGVPTNAFAVTPASGVSTVTVKLTVTMPTTATNAAQAGTVDLSKLAFNLQQNTRP